MEGPVRRSSSTRSPGPEQLKQKLLDTIGDAAATLINNGHSYSEVAKYSLSTLFYLIENLSQKYSGSPNKTTHNEYPVHQRKVTKSGAVVRYGDLDDDG